MTKIVKWVGSRPLLQRIMLHDIGAWKARFKWLGLENSIALISVIGFLAYLLASATIFAPPAGREERLRAIEEERIAANKVQVAREEAKSTSEAASAVAARIAEGNLLGAVEDRASDFNVDSFLPNPSTEPTRMLPLPYARKLANVSEQIQESTAQTNRILASAGSGTLDPFSGLSLYQRIFGAPSFMEKALRAADGESKHTQRSFYLTASIVRDAVGRHYTTVLDGWAQVGNVQQKQLAGEINNDPNRINYLYRSLDFYSLAVSREGALRLKPISSMPTNIYILSRSDQELREFCIVSLRTPLSEITSFTVQAIRITGGHLYRQKP